MYRLSYEQLRQRMSINARNIGISAIICTAIMPDIIFLGLGLGFFALLLAFLSKGYNDKMDHMAKIGVTLGAIAIAISVAIGAYTVNSVVKNPEILTEAVNGANEIYGAEYKELYGKDVNELFYETFGDYINGKK